MDGLFRNRSVAGQVLAPKLRAYAQRPDVIVLGLTRGGVAVAAEVARKLRVPFDVLVVRKLGLPEQPELALGAIASGGAEFLDEAVVTALGVARATLAAILRREQTELERQEIVYRRNRSFPDLAGRTVILVDDGIATASTVRAALQSVRGKRAAAVTVAAPVASSEAVESLRRDGVTVITVLTAERLFAIGDYYQDFRPLTDAALRALLHRGTTGRSDSKSAAA